MDKSIFQKIFKGDILSIFKILKIQLKLIFKKSVKDDKAVKLNEMFHFFLFRGKTADAIDSSRCNASALNDWTRNLNEKGAGDG